jgi:hypothetical protein
VITGNFKLYIDRICRGINEMMSELFDVDEIKEYKNLLENQKSALEAQNRELESQNEKLKSGIEIANLTVRLAELKAKAEIAELRVQVAELQAKVDIAGLKAQMAEMQGGERVHKRARLSESSHDNGAENN